MGEGNKLWTVLFFVMSLAFVTSQCWVKAFTLFLFVSVLSYKLTNASDAYQNRPAITFLVCRKRVWIWHPLGGSYTQRDHPTYGRHVHSNPTLSFATFWVASAIWVLKRSIVYFKLLVLKHLNRLERPGAVKCWLICKITSRAVQQAYSKQVRLCSDKINCITCIKAIQIVTLDNNLYKHKLFFNSAGEHEALSTSLA